MKWELARQDKAEEEKGARLGWRRGRVQNLEQSLEGTSFIAEHFLTSHCLSVGHLRYLDFDLCLQLLGERLDRPPTPSFLSLLWV